MGRRSEATSNMNAEAITVMVDGMPVKTNRIRKGTITRVVSGNLGYVDVKDLGIIAFKPSQVQIRKSDGNIVRYRGQPFGDIDMKEGKTVHVASLEYPRSTEGQKYTILIDEPDSAANRFLRAFFKRK